MTTHIFVEGELAPFLTFATGEAIAVGYFASLMGWQASGFERWLDTQGLLIPSLEQSSTQCFSECSVPKIARGYVRGNGHGTVNSYHKDTIAFQPNADLTVEWTRQHPCAGEDLTLLEASTL